MSSTPTPFNNTDGGATSPAKPTGLGTIGLASVDANGVQSLSGASGFNGVVGAATTAINNSANAINGSLANFNPSDPGSLLQMQQQLANYNLAITVTSSIIKSLEGTVQAVAQKL